MVFQEKLQAYAALAVRVGVNIQPGQYLLVNTSVDALAFTLVLKRRTQLVLVVYK